MKQVLFVVFCAVLLCGCSKSNTDAAKIEVLSQKVDRLLIEVDSLKSQFTNLPTARYLNGMNFYYHTNTITQMGDCLKATADLISLQGKSIVDDVNAQTRQVGFVSVTNIMNDTSQILDQLQQISLQTSAIQFSITNWPPVSTSDKNLIEMESEVWATKDEIREMDHDLIKIKAQLGINY